MKTTFSVSQKNILSTQRVAMKDKWVIHQDRDEEDEENYSYTITLHPKYSGWCTDSGAYSYGFPKELAQWICDKLNESEENCPYTMDYGVWKKKEEKDEAA